MAKRKFCQGMPINTVGHFADLISAGCWIYYRHKPIHPEWAMSWTFRFVQQSIADGYLKVAVKVA